MLQISLGLHDPARGDDAVDLANQDFAEQSTGQINRIRWNAMA